jgi:hypothetical protein
MAIIKDLRGASRARQSGEALSSTAAPEAPARGD